MMPTDSWKSRHNIKNRSTSKRQNAKAETHSWWLEKLYMLSVSKSGKISRTKTIKKKHISKIKYKNDISLTSEYLRFSSMDIFDVSDT